MTAYAWSRPVAQFAAAPAEYRGLARDEVRLLVAHGQSMHHTRFTDLASHLRRGDLLVVNDSRTQAHEYDGLLETRSGGRPVVVHVGGNVAPTEGGGFVVELRSVPDAAEPVLDAAAGQVVRVGRSRLRLEAAYPDGAGGSAPRGRSGQRLWRSTWLDQRRSDLAAARPIAYGYLDARYPVAAYQTVFGTRPGSAEMPSAGRPFSPRVVRSLGEAGVILAPITLHTGLSSQEAGEGPQSEWFEVPELTAATVAAVRARGGRVVAVGTTATRALESAVSPSGEVYAASGWTDRVIGPDAPVRVVTGLISGWHDPEASHLALVESVAGSELTHRAYAAALAQGYLWHEFGDSCLLLPDRA